MRVASALFHQLTSRRFDRPYNNRTVLVPTRSNREFGVPKSYRVRGVPFTYLVSPGRNPCVKSW